MDTFQVGQKVENEQDNRNTDKSVHKLKEHDSPSDQILCLIQHCKCQQVKMQCCLADPAHSANCLSIHTIH